MTNSGCIGCKHWKHKGLSKDPSGSWRANGECCVHPDNVVLVPSGHIGDKETYIATPQEKNGNRECLDFEAAETIPEQ